MANEVIFKRGLSTTLNACAIQEGQVLLCTDERALYFDIDASTRIRVGDFIQVDAVANLPEGGANTTALYYCVNENVLAKWDGEGWVQINLDTGATSVEVTGEGNAITGASYDATTRKITFTKDATYATPGEVDSKIEAKAGDLTYNEVKYDTVKAYVDAKTSGIATDAALGDLQARVTTNEGDIAGLKTKVGETPVADQIDDKIEALDLANTYEAKGEAAKVQGNLDTLAGKVGEVPADKTVVQMISDAQTAATYDDTEVKEDIAANADAIALLNDGAAVEGSVDYKIAQAVAAIMENPDETMNSINELVTWIDEHAESALALSNQVTTNKNDIADLKTKMGEESVETQIENAIKEALGGAEEGTDKYALATDLAAAIERIVALEGKSHEHANKDVIDGITAQNITDWNDAVSKEHVHANESTLNGITDEKVAAWDASEQNAKDYADSLAENYDEAGAAAQALTDAKDYADSLVLTWGTF